MDADQRDLFELHQFESPDLPFFYHTPSPVGTTDMVGNWHDSVEILLVTEGGGTLLYDTDRYPLAVGDVVVVNSGAAHHVTGEPTIFYHCLIVGVRFCTDNGFDPAALRFAPCFRDAQIADLLLGAAEAFSLAQDAPFRVLRIRAAVLRLMSVLCEKHAEPCLNRGTFSDLVREAIRRINLNFTRKFSLDTLCAEIGASKYHFLREFKKHTGYTPVTYVNLLRCTLAARLLAGSEENVGAIARACGFENLSYFSRTFLRYRGKLPSAYRAELRAAPVRGK